VVKASSVPGFDPDSLRPVPYCWLPGVRVTHGRTTEAGAEYFLKSSSGRLLKLGEHERFLWDQFDATRSFAEIEGEFSGRFGMALAVSDFADFLDELIDARAVVRIPEGGRRVTLDLGADAAPESAATAAASDDGSAKAAAGGVTMAAAGKAGFAENLPQVFGHSGGAFAALVRMFRPVRSDR
jgi:hypothetical protein